MEVIRGSWSYQVHIPICVSSKSYFNFTTTSKNRRLLILLILKTFNASDWKQWACYALMVCLIPLSPPFFITSIFSRFDCYSFDIPNRAEDQEGLYRAVNWINKIISIEESEHNIPPNRIIIGGLSQGGAVSLLTTITIEKPLAGLFALSTYVPLPRKTTEVILLYSFVLSE